MTGRTLVRPLRLILGKIGSIVLKTWLAWSLN